MSIVEEAQMTEVEELEARIGKLEAQNEMLGKNLTLAVNTVANAVKQMRTVANRVVALERTVKQMGKGKGNGRLHIVGPGD